MTTPTPMLSDQDKITRGIDKPTALSLTILNHQLLYQIAKYIEGLPFFSVWTHTCTNIMRDDRGDVYVCGCKPFHLTHLRRQRQSAMLEAVSRAVSRCLSPFARLGRLLWVGHRPHLVATGKHCSLPLDVGRPGNLRGRTGNSTRASYRRETEDHRTRREIRGLKPLIQHLTIEWCTLRSREQVQMLNQTGRRVGGEVRQRCKESGWQLLTPYLAMTWLGFAANGLASNDVSPIDCEITIWGGLADQFCEVHWD